MKPSYKFADRREAQKFWSEWVNPLVRILSGDVYDRVNNPHGGYNYIRRYAGRPWFIQQHDRHQLHPAVVKMLELYMPATWQRLILEWPHKSLTDPNRLAYTRDEKSAMYEGDSDKKALVTSIGKYLTRHWPDVPSDIIRDIVAEHTYGGTISITSDIKRMVQVVSGGPRSCMSSRFDIRCADGKMRHPYEVYDPSLGWSMAVRVEGDEVLGRCLIWSDPDSSDTFGFVRSYKRERNECSHSGADEAIEAYLKSMGYTKWGGWPDETPLMQYETERGGYLMPYIDGGNQQVERGDDGYLFVAENGGEFQADSTAGVINQHNCTCEDCGDGFDEDDGYWTGIHEDRHVCQSCCDENYTYAYSRRGNQYYINNDNVIEADGEWYDDRHLSDNSIIELHKGDYTHSDNAVYIESCDEYYEQDDDDICYAENTNRYELVDDCWQCTESGNWYTDDEDYVEVDGDKYHPDHAPEVDDDEDEDEDEDEAETAVEVEPTLVLTTTATVEVTLDERFSLAA